MRKVIAGIMASTPSGVVGIDTQLPWHIKEELKHFKKITLQYDYMVMGSTTYNSLPCLLKDRKHIILTNQELSNSDSEQIIIEKDNWDIIQKYNNFIVIGGPKTMKAFMQYITTFHLSIIKKEYVGNVYFNKNRLRDFKIKTEEEFEEFTYRKYVRNKNISTLEAHW